MIRLRPFLLPLLLLAGCSENPEPRPEPEPIGPYLWEATGELGTVYLFGTIHVPAQEVLDLPPVVRHAIDDADVVLTELELNAETIGAVQRLMMLPKGETLQTVIPKEDYERISKKVPLSGMKAFKPWAAAQQLLLLHGAKYFMTGKKPMDLTIPVEAAAAGKETGALETPEEQIAIFESLSMPEQIRMLEKTADMIVKDRKEKTDTIGTMVEVYLAGDIAKMAEFATTYGGEPDDLDRKFMKALIDDRNATMAERILERMEKERGRTWFVAVGAAHHWGPKGLPALLRARGFTVRRQVELPATAK